MCHNPVAQWQAVAMAVAVVIVVVIVIVVVAEAAIKYARARESEGRRLCFARPNGKLHFDPISSSAQHPAQG